MSESITKEDEELLVMESISINISGYTRMQMFVGHSVITDEEQDRIMSTIYTKEELDTIREDGVEFYGEDDKLENAINDEFHRIVEKGGRYDFYSGDTDA